MKTFGLKNKMKDISKALENLILCAKLLILLELKVIVNAYLKEVMRYES